MHPYTKQNWKSDDHKRTIHPKFLKSALWISLSVFTTTCSFAQTTDTLPSFRRFCQNSYLPDSIKTYQYTTSILVTQDTTFTSSFTVSAGTALIIKNGVKVSFCEGDSILVEGGS